jgi:hypothetical protein
MPAIQNLDEDTPSGDLPEKPEVTITYNGIDNDVAYNPQAAVQALLGHAMNAFGVRENRHLMALWTTAGAELPLDVSASDAGVKPHDVLVLRPSAVRGGAC